MSALWEWFSGALTYLGLWKKQSRLLFIGLDNAGKTTLLHMLKDDEFQLHHPTLNNQKESFRLWEKNIIAYDLIIERDLLSYYFPVADAVVLVIDAQDQDRFEEAKKYLDKALHELRAMGPVLVLGNKSDTCLAVSEEALKTAFGLHDKTTGKGEVSIEELSPKRPLEVFMCSAKKKQGYEEGFKWMLQYLP